MDKLLWIRREKGGKKRRMEGKQDDRLPRREAGREYGLKRKKLIKREKRREKGKKDDRKEKA